MGDKIGNLFYPGNMLPFIGGKGLPAEGREGVPTPPRPGGRGGREVVAAVLRAPMHRHRGKGTGRTTLSWEEKFIYSIQFRNNEIYHFFFSLFPKHFICCQPNL